jgi:hypothetical protein
MGTRAEAAKLFMGAMHEDTMQDRWIVDEEWVRYIRSSSSCSKQVKIYDMNMGISKICIWCNDRCSLDGHVLLHNAKVINLPNKKVSRTHFYYVLSSPDKPAPTIPSDQKFYQELWNNRRASSRCLKRTVQSNPKNDRNQPSKKTRAVESPTPKSQPSAIQMPQSLPDELPTNPKTSLGPDPPESFDQALDLLLLAWNATYPKYKFPVDKVAFYPNTNSPLVPQPNTIRHAQQAVPSQQFAGPTTEEECVEPIEEEGVLPSSSTHDVRLPSGHIVSNLPNNYTLVVKNDLARFRRDRAFMNAMKKVIRFKQNQPTNHTRHLFGAFAGSHPQIATMYLEQIIALARHSLLLEVKAVCESDYSSLQTDFRWLTLSNVGSSSPIFEEED